MSSNIDRQSQIPRVEKTDARIKVIFNDTVLAETDTPVLVLEFGLPPVYYIPKEDVKMEYLRLTDRQTHCSWKGDANYFDISVDNKTARNAAWIYPDPKKRFQTGRDHLAFYPGKLDACYVNGKKVVHPEKATFTGWITEEEQTGN